MTTAVPHPARFRENVRAKLAAATGLWPAAATNLEIGVFNGAVSAATELQIVKKWENPLFVQVYVNRLHSVYTNACAPANAARLRARTIAPQDFAMLSPQDMAPEAWRELVEKKNKRDASRFENTMHASTDMFKCKKCRSIRCSYYELQTRSADEPMTLFIQCLDCGKQWKQ